jgi:prepilin-type N-terminal cleavage/methylation domain-containing protein/prepilin-type processing-associated H-X9-DG protein
MTVRKMNFYYQNMMRPSGNRSAFIASKKGFSLIELLAAIAIVVILLGLTVTSLSSAREKANIVKCQSNLRQIGTAINLYTSDHRGVYPGLVWYSLPIDVWRMSGYVPLTLKLAPYFDLPEWSDMGQDTCKVGVAICPTHQANNPASNYHYARHPNPSESPFGGDENGTFSETLTVFNVAQRLGKEPVNIMAVRDNPLPAPATVHDGGQNVLFLDGHVEWIEGRDVPDR